MINNQISREACAFSIHYGVDYLVKTLYKRKVPEITQSPCKTLNFNTIKYIINDLINIKDRSDILLILIVEALCETVQPLIWNNCNIITDEESKLIGKVEGVQNGRRLFLAIEIVDQPRPENILDFQLKTENLKIPLCYILTMKTIDGGVQTFDNDILVIPILDFILHYLNQCNYHDTRITTTYMDHLQQRIDSSNSIDEQTKVGANSIFRLHLV